MTRAERLRVGWMQHDLLDSIRTLEPTGVRVLAEHIGQDLQATRCALYRLRKRGLVRVSPQHGPPAVRAPRLFRLTDTGREALAEANTRSARGRATAMP